MGDLIDFHKKGKGPHAPAQAASTLKGVQAVARELVPQPRPMPDLQEWGRQRKARLFRMALAISIASAAIWVAILVNRSMNRPDELAFVWGLGVCGVYFCSALFLLTGALQDVWWRFFATFTSITFFVLLCREFPAVFWAVLREVMVFAREILVHLQPIQGLTQ